MVMARQGCKTSENGAQNYKTFKGRRHLSAKKGEGRVEPMQCTGYRLLQESEEVEMALREFCECKSPVFKAEEILKLEKNVKKRAAPDVCSDGTL